MLCVKARHFNVYARVAHLPCRQRCVAAVCPLLKLLDNAGLRTQNGGVHITGFPVHGASKSSHPVFTRAGLVIAVILFVACSGNPRDVAVRGGMTETEIAGTAFRHVVFEKPGILPDGSLHIYIEGDGRPWINGRIPAADPTPADPLALRLMAEDTTDAVYIGRPCYFGTATDPGCGADSWTSGRYSSDVIASMAAVAGKLINRGAYRDVVLIGYSGGGVIALLLAPSTPRLAGLLTVAANLDTAAWTELHGYLPLDGSENPAVDGSTLPDGVVHVQVIGGRDDVVPASVTESYSAHKGGLEVWQYPQYDHGCCWVAIWPELLTRFAAYQEHKNALSAFAQ